MEWAFGVEFGKTGELIPRSSFLLFSSFLSLTSLPSCFVVSTLVCHSSTGQHLIPQVDSLPSSHEFVLVRFVSTSTRPLINFLLSFRCQNEKTLRIIKIDKSGELEGRSAGQTVKFARPIKGVWWRSSTK